MHRKECHRDGNSLPKKKIERLEPRAHRRGQLFPNKRCVYEVRAILAGKSVDGHATNKLQLDYDIQATV